MRQLVGVVALGVVLFVVVGMGFRRGGPLDPTSVRLLTGSTGCYAGGEGGAGGLLVADPDYGTRFNGQPVLWPDGFRAARVGDDVEVLDDGGNVIARTGRHYYISYAAMPNDISEEVRHVANGVGAFPAAAQCPYPWDFVDCWSPRLGYDETAAAARFCVAITEHADS